MQAMRGSVRRTGRHANSIAWSAIAAAIIVHGTVVGTVHGLGLSLVGNGFSRRERAPEVAKELRAGCIADAVLAAGARGALCVAPWRRDVDDCLAEAQLDTLVFMSACWARDGHRQEVAMLDARPIDRFKSIDPEPLLDAIQPEAPTPPPPKDAPAPVPAQPAPPTPPPPQRPMQVVETAKPQAEQAPDNARLLAEYDTKVDKQTVARGTPKEPMVAKSKPEELRPKDHAEEPAVKEPPVDRPRGDRHAPDAPGTLAMRQPGARVPDEVKQDPKTRGAANGATGPASRDGYTAQKGDGAVEQQRRDRSEQPRGQDGGGGGAPPVPNLKPSKEVLERAIGGGNVDHLDEVDSGDETALSAKRWVYASFFNRLKRSVAQNWDPATVWRRVDPTGAVNGFKTRVTEVRVSLSAKGELSKIVITSPSGVGDLDDEAVRAFHAAAPFPNPPKELVGGDSLITFAFSFYFEIGGSHTTWRVLRSN